LRDATGGRVRQAQQGHRALPGSRVRPDHKALPVHPARRALKETLDCRGLLDLRA